MRLTQFTDIGLRAVLLLAARPGHVSATGDLARRLRVSKDHLAKSLQTLHGLGIVSSVRGRDGGFVLNAPASSVRLGALVKRLEPSLAMAECFENGSSCPLTGRCRLAGVLSEAQRGFFDALDRYTLEDLVIADQDVLVQIGDTGAGTNY